MKKLISLILIVLISCLVLSCNGNNPEPNSTPTQNPSQESPYPTEESLKAPTAKDGAITAKLDTVKEVTIALDNGNYDINNEGLLSYNFDSSGDLLYREVYVSQSESIYYIEKDIDSLKKGDVFVWKDGNVTLNGNSSSDSIIGSLTSKSDSYHAYSYSTYSTKEFSYDSKTFSIEKSIQSIDKIKDDNSINSMRFDSYTIEGGDIKGVTYIGMYYSFESSHYQSPNRTYSNVVFEIRGNSDIAGIYTVTPEEFKTLRPNL